MIYIIIGQLFMHIWKTVFAAQTVITEVFFASSKLQI